MTSIGQLNDVLRIPVDVVLALVKNDAEASTLLETSFRAQQLHELLPLQSMHQECDVSTIHKACTSIISLKDPSLSSLVPAIMNVASGITQASNALQARISDVLARIRHLSSILIQNAETNRKIAVELKRQTTCQELALERQILSNIQQEMGQRAAYVARVRGHCTLPPFVEALESIKSDAAKKFKALVHSCPPPLIPPIDNNNTNNNNNTLLNTTNASKEEVEALAKQVKALTEHIEKLSKHQNNNNTAPGAKGPNQGGGKAVQRDIIIDDAELDAPSPSRHAQQQNTHGSSRQGILQPSPRVSETLLQTITLTEEDIGKEQGEEEEVKNILIDGEEKENIDIVQSQGKSSQGQGSGEEKEQQPHHHHHSIDANTMNAAATPKMVMNDKQQLSANNNTVHDDPSSSPSHHQENTQPQATEDQPSPKETPLARYGMSSAPMMLVGNTPGKFPFPSQKDSTSPPRNNNSGTKFGMRLANGGDDDVCDEAVNAKRLPDDAFGIPFTVVRNSQRKRTRFASEAEQGGASQDDVMGSLEGPKL